MDWNNDGKLDLIAGDTNGNVTLFLNVGTREKPQFAKGKPVEAAGKAIASGSHKGADTYSKLHMGDLDGDGLKDLLIGHTSSIMFYKNTGTPAEPRFAAPVPLSLPGRMSNRPSPYLVDWDGDGVNDLLLGTEMDGVMFYRNTGTNQKPKMQAAQKLDLKIPKAEAGYRWRIDVTDWNSDGKKDILVGNFYSSGNKAGGNVWLFLGM